MTKSRGLREHHGMRRTRAYAIWSGMRARCRNPKHAAFADYGGRGITVCDRWAKFSAFYADMGEPPRAATLERSDNDAGYAPGNCRWATRTEQNRNRRNNVLITIGAETLPLSAWADRCGLRYATVHQRILKGWPPELAVTTPLVTRRRGVPRGERVAAWGAENGVAWTDPTLTGARGAA